MVTSYFCRETSKASPHVKRQSGVETHFGSFATEVLLIGVDTCLQPTRSKVNLLRESSLLEGRKHV